MVLKQKIQIEVAYATKALQRIITIQVDQGCSIQDAIYQSGILQLFPEIDLAKQKVGVFSKQKSLSDILQENDRVEIYRPLVMDPKEARRMRVKPAAKRKYKKRGFRK